MTLSPPVSTTSPEIFSPPEPDEIRKVRSSRPASTEGREAALFQQQEIKRADQQLTRELRDNCRPEIEDYVECTQERVFSVMACKALAMKMRRCLVKYKTGTDVVTRRSEILEEMQKNGEVMDREWLAKRNNLFWSEGGKAGVKAASRPQDGSWN